VLTLETAATAAQIAPTKFVDRRQSSRTLSASEQLDADRRASGERRSFVERRKYIPSPQSRTPIVTYFLLIFALMMTVFSIMMVRISHFQDDALQRFQHVASVIDRSRQAQIEFRLQVQEWKNILLRGHYPELYQKHVDAFRDQDRKTAQLLVTTAQDAKRYGFDYKPLLAVIEAHEKMHDSYFNALRLYNKNNLTSFTAVDEKIRGIDRPLIASLDQYVESLQKLQKQEVMNTASERESLNDQLFWVIASTFVIALGLIVLMIFRSSPVVVSKERHRS
jgi:hypothetical protein